MIPPTTTAQQKKVNFKTKTIYANSSAVDARNKYRAHLAAHEHKNGEPCTNKPDLDNANKILQDVMQELGFFKDDKNIVQLNLSKIWTWHPGVMIELKKVGEE